MQALQQGPWEGWLHLAGYVIALGIIIYLLRFRTRIIPIGLIIVAAVHAGHANGPHSYLPNIRLATFSKTYIDLDTIYSLIGITGRCLTVFFLLLGLIHLIRYISSSVWAARPKFQVPPKARSEPLQSANSQSGPEAQQTPLKGKPENQLSSGQTSPRGVLVNQTPFPDWQQHWSSSAARTSLRDDFKNVEDKIEDSGNLVRCACGQMNRISAQAKQAGQFKCGQCGQTILTVSPNNSYDASPKPPLTGSFSQTRIAITTAIILIPLFLVGLSYSPSWSLFGSKSDANKRNFGEVLKRHLRSAHFCLTDWAEPGILYSVSKSSQSQIDELAKRGIIKVTKVQPEFLATKIHAEFTSSGQSWNRASGFDQLNDTPMDRPCIGVGRLELEEVSNFTVPSAAAGMKISEVEWSYRLKELPDWLSQSVITSRWAGSDKNWIAVALRGGEIATRSVLILKDDGWEHQRFLR